MTCCSARRAAPPCRPLCRSDGARRGRAARRHDGDFWCRAPCRRCGSTSDLATSPVSTKSAAGNLAKVRSSRGANIHPQFSPDSNRLRSRWAFPTNLKSPPAIPAPMPGRCRSAAGVPTGLLSIPITSMHSPVECVDLGDIASTGRLLASYASRLDPEEVRGWHHVFV